MPSGTASLALPDIITFIIIAPLSGPTGYRVIVVRLEFDCIRKEGGEVIPSPPFSFDHAEVEDYFPLRHPLCPLLLG
jgi:hypothetical protein